MGKTLSRAIFVTLMALSSLSAQDQKEPSATGAASLGERVDALFAEWDRPDSPGAAVAVVRDGFTVFRRGYGSAQLEYNIPITPSTVFHVASVSKQFTAFAIAMLAEQGRLSLDDDIRAHLPEAPDFGAKITLRHLLHHTSGLRDQWELLAVAGWRLDDVITTEHILNAVAHQRELNFEPGSEFLYCNTGYTLQAEIVARTTGKSFKDWTKENIFEPLGMVDTHFHDDHQEVVKNRAYSYFQSDDGAFSNAVLSYANAGATSLFTTAEDMANWMRNFEEARVGGRAVIERMLHKGVLNDGREIDYALGLSIGVYRGLRTISHSGGDAGFRSHMVIFPEQRFGVVVLSNLGSFNPSRQAYRVADIFLSDSLAPEVPQSAPAETAVVSVDPAVLAEYTGKYRMPQNYVLHVVMEEKDLFAQGIGPKNKLAPLSDTDFLIADAGARITFLRDEGGAIDRIALSFGNETFEGTKVELPDPTPELLRSYCGTYYSDELGAFYEFTLVGADLVAHHRRHGDFTLRMNDLDFFIAESWFFNRIRFQRGAGQEVAGFLLEGRRARNLRFRKLDW